MKPGIPWSIKGVEPELREVAKSAARRSGLTLGEWLNSAINEQADAPADAPTSAPKMQRSSLISTHPMERAATKLEDIAEQLSKLAMRESDTSYRQPAQSVDDSIAIAKVLNRVESSERQTVEAFSAVNERLATISRQLRVQQPSPVLTPAPIVAKPEDSLGYQTLEKAVRNIVEHLEVSDKRTRENMKTLQERMGEMSARVSGAASEQVLRQAPAFSQLESRLSDLAQRIEQVPQAAHNAGSDELRQEMQALAARIDTVRDTSETLAQKAQTQAVQASQAELRVIEQRILGLLNEAQQSIAANQTQPHEIQRFKGDIDLLHKRVDEAAKGSASGQDVSALRSVVEQLSTRVAQGPDTRPLADLERRMVALDQRLNESLQNKGNAGSTAALEQQLADVNERLGKTEHQLTHLETIERAISQLYDSLEQNRQQTQALAQDTATHLQGFANNTAQAPVMLAGMPEIVALEEGLKAVRQASHQAETHNQETLEAVHETLEQIVTKLSELETAAIGQRVAQAVAPMVPHLADETLIGSTSQFAQQPQFSQETLPTAAEMFVPEPQASGNFMDPVFAELNNPFVEPAKANPFNPASQAGATPAAAIDGIEDLVAVARRAQRAANEQKSGISGIIPNLGGKAAKKPSGFKLPFNLGGKTKAEPAAAVAMTAPANNNSRRRLAILGIVLLSLTSAVIFNKVGQHLKVADPTPVSEQVAPADPLAPAKSDAPIAAIEPTPEPATAEAAQLPAAAAPPAQPEPAPLAVPNVPGATNGQQSDASSSNESDPILTGALPAPVKPMKDVITDNIIDPAVGPAKLRQAAQSGDVSAAFIVATHYLNGDTVSSDYNKAAFWYGKAAAAGSAPAQYRLATLYERGKGVGKNLNTALSWYERAGALGNVKAMHNAAVIAAGSEAGSPDYARATKWFTLAASHGLKDSQFNLAVLKERGLGVKPDTNEALFWYMAAAAQDDADAKKRVEVLSKSLSPATVESVSARFKSWAPEKAPDAANVVAVNDAQWNPSDKSAAIPQNLNDQAKALLDKMGYRVGEKDGLVDQRTANAVRLFQIQQGLKVTGKITPELLSLMRTKAG
jgi:localization factor PodJL